MWEGGRGHRGSTPWGQRCFEPIWLLRPQHDFLIMSRSAQTQRYDHEKCPGWEDHHNEAPIIILTIMILGIYCHYYHLSFYYYLKPPSPYPQRGGVGKEGVVTQTGVTGLVLETLGFNMVLHKVHPTHHQAHAGVFGHQCRFYYVS